MVTDLVNRYIDPMLKILSRFSAIRFWLEFKLDFMYNVKPIATKAFVFVAPLRFPRNPFLFPLPPELSFVVRYRATQTQRKQTAAKATVVNKKSDFSLKTSRKHTDQLHCNISSTRNFLATFLRLK